MNSKYLKGLGVNILLLGIVSFLNDVSSEMVMPILPMFIKSLGGAGLAVGLAGGFRDSIPSILNVLAGYWSDKTGKRKIFISAGYLVSSVFKLFLTFSRTWHQAVIFSGLERTGKGLRNAARDTLIAESAGTQRGKGFGIHRAFDSSGAILGSVVAFILSGVFGLDFKLVILIAGIIAFVSLVPLRFVKEGKGQFQPQKTSQRVKLRELPRLLSYSSRLRACLLWRILAICFLFSKRRRHLRANCWLGRQFSCIFFSTFSMPALPFLSVFYRTESEGKKSLSSVICCFL